AYIAPVYLRLRQGDKFQPGPWTLGHRYKWVNIGAIAFVVLVVLALDIPFTFTGVPWNKGFDITAVNYIPLVLVVRLLVGVWWAMGPKHKYNGRVRTRDGAACDAASPPDTQGTPPAP